LAITTVVWLIQTHVPSLAARALPAATILVLGVGNVGWLLVNSVGSYLRAWRREPLTEAVVTGVAIVSLGTIAAATRMSVLGTVWTHSALVICGVLPITALGFRRHRQADS
jgi:hypothetical protein